MTYLIDVFPERSAAASAALNLSRCLFAAGGTSVVMPISNAIGAGWTFTICAGVQLLALLGGVAQSVYNRKQRKQAELEQIVNDNSSKV